MDKDEAVIRAGARFKYNPRDAEYDEDQNDSLTERLLRIGMDAAHEERRPLWTAAAFGRPGELSRRSGR